jgi:hypothetical protein
MITNLPIEILSMIAENLVGNDILVFERTSKLFYEICKQPVFWKRKIINEFPGEITLNSQSLDFKRMYLEYCFYTWFSVCILQGNFDEIETFQILCRNVYCKITDIEYFCIFNTTLANSKKQMYKVLHQKMTPPENKVLALKSYTGENDIYVPYLDKDEIDYLLSENTNCSLVSTNQQSCVNTKESEISHLMIINGSEFYNMNFHVLGRRIKRELDYVFALVSIYFSSNECDVNPDGSQIPDDSKLNFIDFFESTEEIVEWMNNGNLVKTSDIISDDDGRYKITNYGIGGEYYTYESYSNLTNDIMKTLRLGGIYKLSHGQYEDTNDYYEIIVISIREDSSFNFRNHQEFKE